VNQFFRFSQDAPGSEPDVSVQPSGSGSEPGSYCIDLSHGSDACAAGNENLQGVELQGAQSQGAEPESVEPQALSYRSLRCRALSRRAFSRRTPICRALSRKVFEPQGGP